MFIIFVYVNMLIHKKYKIYVNYNIIFNIFMYIYILFNNVSPFLFSLFFIYIKNTYHLFFYSYHTDITGDIDKNNHIYIYINHIDYIYQK